MSETEFSTPGQTSIILVAPHGYMGKPSNDDELTAEIAIQMQKMLNCYAVVNRTYRRPKGADPIFDRDKKICNLNNMSQYKDEAPDLYDAFVGAIRRFKDEIEAQGHIPYIFHIHGASTSQFDNACKKEDVIKYKDINILIGTGRGFSAKGKGESLTALPNDVDSLIAGLKEEQLIAYSTNHGEYAAKKASNLNQLFRSPNYPDEKVLSFQLEIRKQGLRDKPVTAANTARRLAAAISKFTGVAICLEADAMEPDEAFPVNQEKIEEAVQHILSEYKEAYGETINRMVNIGKYLVENFFGNRFEKAANPRNINSDQSLHQIQEKLKEHLGRASKTWVYDALKVSVDYHMLEGTDVFQTYGNLSNSHKVKLAYADEKDKKELIIGCVAENWPVRRLNDEIKKRKSPRRRSSINALLSLIKKPDELPVSFPEETFQGKFNELKPEEQQKIKKETEVLLQKAEQELAALEERKKRYEHLLKIIGEQ